jgi:F0F1-type ATP synthase assembly protein I
MTGGNGGGNGLDSGRKPADSGSSIGQFAGAGFQFAAMVILSAFAGIWIDRELGTGPWLLIVTVFVGAALGFYSLYRNLMKGQRLGDRRQHGERRGDRQ